MDRRIEVDGLRSVAVIPIILYHSGLSQLHGGFVGVDVFFVISGFLITSIIQREIAARDFSIFAFYERRARRILPALVFMMIPVLLFGYLALAPSPFEELAKSAASAGLFASNIFFWQEINYFSSDAEYWPLIHTWSLGVEEQFYLIHPILMILILRLRSAAWQKAIMATLLLGSFALCILVTQRWPSAAFNLLPTRFWELGVGAALAMGMMRIPERRVLREGLAGLGVVLLGVSIFLYDEAIAFPGWWAALPVAGTALVIATGGQTVVGRVLSTRPLVFIGLISYSLYLWHWPILAFARHAHGTVDLPAPVAIACVIAMSVMAWVSWRFVERPFRNRDFLTRRSVLGGAAATMVVFAGFGLMAALTNGLPGRLTKEQLQIARAGSEFRGGGPCWDRTAKEGYCRIGDPKAAPTVLIWGDSHAGALIPAFDRALAATGQSGFIATMGACPPLLGVRRSDYESSDCTALNTDVRDWLKQGGKGVRHVIITARWNLNATGTRPAGEAGRRARLARLDGQPGGDMASVFDYGLRTTVKDMTDIGLKVTLLDDVPEIGWNVPGATVFRMRFGLPQPEAPTLDSVRARGQVADRILVATARDYSARFISLNDLLCTPTCATIVDGEAIYADDDHLSVRGAREYVSGLLLERGVITP